MYRESRLCCFRCDAVKANEFNFVNDSLGRAAIRCGGFVCAAGIASLRVCEGRGNDEQPKKQRGYRNATAHVSLHLETD
jgi:hypothetical protein